MYLKALTLKGFKSFADKTELSFEQGVTVVVGPNGSGKSNLVDAVAWVLGAQGARALRGAKMDDVIFAGTTKKSALGRAEVALTIDNSDQTLPIEFNEVTITRTLFRSGESEYKINEVPCRLLDIQELLSDSRIGRTQHVIVGQGQLDSVLNASPQDRRAIIEEAAGVLKYRKRREKSQRRLEASGASLIRLQDLTREVKRQLSPLQRQADAAKRHDGVRDELNAIRLFLLGKEISGLQASIERNESESLEKSRKEKELLSELSALDVEILGAESALMKVGDSDVAKWLSRCEKLVNSASASISILNERRRSISAEMDSAADESVIESLLLERDNISAKINELNALKSELAPKLEEARTLMHDVQAQLNSHIDAKPNAQVAKDYENALRELENKERNLSRLQTQKTASSNRHDSITSRISALGVDNADAKDVVDVETIELNNYISEHDELENKMNHVRTELEDIEKEKLRCQEESAQLNAEAKVLNDAFNASNHSSGIEYVRNKDGVQGTLLENISIDEKVGEAANSIIGSILQSIVVDSKQNIESTIEELLNSNSSAQVMMLEGNKESHNEDAPAGTTALINFISSSNDAIMQLLGKYLSNVVFCEGEWKTALKIAVENPRFIVVTNSGDRFGSDMPWILGKSKTVTVTKEKVLKAKEQAETAKENLANAEQKYAQCYEKSQELINAISTCNASLNECRTRLNIATKTFETTQSAITARTAEVDSLTTEIAVTKEQIDVETSEVEQLKQQLVDLEYRKNNLNVLLEQYNEQKNILDAQFTSAEEILRDIEAQMQSTTIMLDDLNSRLVKVNQRLSKDPAKELEANQRREHAVQAMAKIDQLITRAKAVDESSRQVLEILTNERNIQTQKAQESSTKLESLRTSRRTAEKALVELRELLQRSEINKAEFKLKLTSAVENLRTNFDCEPQVALDAQMPEVLEGSTLTSRARDLDRELKLMGPINPLAIAEFDELTERHVFLNQQLDDIKASRRELQKVIRNIDQEIVSVFEKAFEDVQKHFSGLFTTLFAGGAGRLTLTDPNDMLNTGIDMEARPSGKNVRRLSLLSGGERSLTALAFLFAVFKSRPSPFYIMDEVEAALDEPNLIRFLDLVNEFRNDAQLIIVSHQKKTMEAADELYGVTMSPGGSSRAIKQRIETPKQTIYDIEEGVIAFDLVEAENSEVQDSNNANVDVLESSI